MLGGGVIGSGLDSCKEPDDPKPDEAKSNLRCPCLLVEAVGLPVSENGDDSRVYPLDTDILPLIILYNCALK